MQDYIFDFKKLRVLLPKIKVTHFTLKHLHTNRSVTLIELIMVIVVVGVLAGGLSLGVRGVIDLWSFLTFRNEIVSQGRIALMRMSREIKQMSSRDSTFEPIEVAESSRLRFTAIDLDGDDSNDIVEFYCDTENNELRRIFNDIPAEGNILASYVNNLVFTYYDEDNGPAASPSEVYRITITLTLVRGSHTLSLRSQVFPRNLGL